MYPISASELSTTTLIVDSSRNGADYKGLAFGTNTHGNFLFTTNFPAGTVDVFDRASKPKTPDGGFSNSNISAGLAPFGIANIDNNSLLSLDDVFSTNGVLIKRFASGGTLNAP